MSNVITNRALVPLGCGEQFAPHLQHLFSTIDYMYETGEEIELDSIWTPRRNVIIDIAGSTNVFHSGLMDEAKSLELVDLELDRFKLPDDQLGQRELHMRKGFLDKGISLSPDWEMRDFFRIGMANSFRGLGGIAIFGGTPSAVINACDHYYELCQADRTN
jgi:hypothetical protein